MSFNDEQADYIINAYIKDQKSLDMIAKEFGTYVNKIRRFLNKRGVQIRTIGESQKIALDTGNFLFYKDILRNFEDLPVYERDGRYFAKGKEIKEHTFQQNYYFMLGDNRPYSNDSRFIGFIPEENIIGKAVCILFSSGKNGLEWNRTFKLLE